MFILKKKGKTRYYDGQFDNGVRDGFGILTDNFEDIEGFKKDAKFKNPENSDKKEDSDILDQTFRSERTEQQSDISHYYSYRGMWRKGVRAGFGIETYCIEDIEEQRKKPLLRRDTISKTPLNLFSETEYLETKYNGFFINNEKSGEGCVELRDLDYNVAGWYLGRFENGVRHSIGRQVLVIQEEGTPSVASYRGKSVRFEITPKVFNKGNPVPFYDAESVYVDDILTFIDFFGFMSQIEKSDDDLANFCMNLTDE